MNNLSCGSVSFSPRPSRLVPLVLIAFLVVIIAMSLQGQINNTTNAGNIPQNIRGEAEWQSAAAVTLPGSAVVFSDDVASLSNSFEYVIKGGPATVSIPVQGCMRGGTCSAAINTYTGTTSAIVSISGGPYDSYQLLPSWTGGTNVSIAINRVGTASK